MNLLFGFSIKRCYYTYHSAFDEKTLCRNQTSDFCLLCMKILNVFSAMKSHRYNEKDSSLLILNDSKFQKISTIDRC